MKPTFLFFTMLLAACSSSADPTGGAGGSTGTGGLGHGGGDVGPGGGSNVGGSGPAGAGGTSSATGGATGGAGGGASGAVFLGFYSDSFQDLNATIAAASGRGVAIENQRETWGSKFDSAEETFDVGHGVIPLLSWAVAYRNAAGKTVCGTYDKIMKGDYDDDWTDGDLHFMGLRHEAQTVKSWNVPVLIRFYKEFTDTAIDDCFYSSGHPTKDREKNGPMLVGIWQHVVDLFKAEGATNVQWVWGPSANLFGDDGPDDKTWRYFYPGSNYVDWISNDNYNKSSTKVLEYAKDKAIKNFYSLTKGLGKPLMQAETGAGYNANKDPDPMTAWLTSAASTVKNDYPAMKAFVWWSAQGKVDYDLQGPALQVFEQMVKDPYYQATDVSPYATSAGSSGGPTPPTGVAASWAGGAVNVSWTASTDAFGTVTSYNVYRDGVVVGTSATTSFVDMSPELGQSYHYTVDAIDSALNRSLPSAAIMLNGT